MFEVGLIVGPGSEQNDTRIVAGRQGGQGIPLRAKERSQP